MKKLVLLFFALTIAFASFAQTSLVWKFKTGAAIHSSPVISGSSVFVGSCDMNLYSLDKNSGNVNWKFETKGEIRSTPCVFENDIFFNSSDGNIYSLDKNTGKLLWTFATNGENRKDMWDYNLSSPVIYNGAVYVGSGDSTIYAIEAKTGKKIWAYKTNGIVHASPVIRDNVVYAGSFDGSMYALDSRNGNLVWKFKTVGDNSFPKGEIQNAALLFSNTLFFGSRDYNIYAINIKTGTGRWNFKERASWVIATPFLYNKNLYVGTSDSHKFYCLNAGSGEVKWVKPLNMRVYASAALVGGKIAFGSFNGKLYFVDPETGKTDHVFQSDENKKLYSSIYKGDDSFRSDFLLYGETMKAAEESERKILDLGSIISSPAVEGQNLFIGAANGYIYSIINK